MHLVFPCPFNACFIFNNIFHSLYYSRNMLIIIAVVIVYLVYNVLLWDFDLSQNMENKELGIVSNERDKMCLILRVHYYKSLKIPFVCSTLCTLYLLCNKIKITYYTQCASASIRRPIGILGILAGERIHTLLLVQDTKLQNISFECCVFVLFLLFEPTKILGNYFK